MLEHVPEGPPTVSAYAAATWQGVGTDAEHLVLGGQGEMWGETVDASDLEQTVWPRLAAIAESLWSPKGVTASRMLNTRRGVSSF